MTKERLTAFEDVAALATVGATYPELMLYLQTEIAKCEAEQPEQEPVMGTKTWFEDGKVVTQHLIAKDIYKEPEQEPSARLMTYIGRDGAHPKHGYTVARTYAECPKLHYPDSWEEGALLYTTPPKRTWVDLTDDEIQQCYKAAYKVVQGRRLEITLTRALETYLREKNT